MRKRVIVAGLLSLVLCERAFSQSSNATVSGTVTDATGAVLPGVTVTANNSATGVVTTALTNETGTYNFASLLPGVYRVSAELPGFQIRTYTEVQLGNAAQVRLNFTLTVASVAQSVEVTIAANALLTESSSSVGQVLPETQVRDLPLVSNNVLDLVAVMAGVNVTSSPVFGAEQTNFAGVSARDINLQRDGVSINNQRWPNGLDAPTRMNPDLVGEVRMILAPVDAEMGRGNGQVQIQTRSGTNMYRGSAVWNVLNSALDANTWTNNRAGATPDWRNIHQYTVSFGGPIIRNKTFFFALWDQAIIRTRALTNPIVLTPCARNGIFRHFDNVNNGNALFVPVGGATPTVPVVDRSGNPVTNLGPLRYASVFGPLQNTPARPDCSDAVIGRAPTATGTWDSNRTQVDPTGFVNTLLKLMPQANNYEAGDGLNTAGHRWLRTLRGSDNLFGVGDDQQRKQINFKIDHYFNSKQKISGSYSYESDWAGPSPAWPTTFGGRVEKRPQVLTVGFTSTLSATLVNETRFGMSRTGVNTLAAAEASGTGDQLRALLPVVKGLHVVPNLGTGAVNFQNIIPSQWSNRDNSPRYTYADTLSWTKGKHTFKGGGEFRISSSKSTNSGTAVPAASVYSGATGGNAVLAPVAGINNTNLRGLAGTAATGSRAAMENLLTFLSVSGSLSNITQYRFINSNKPDKWNDPATERFKIRDIHQNEFSAFFKDDWKAHKDLTLNLGVRWDYYGVPYEKNGLTAALSGGGASLFGISGRGFDGWMRPGARADLTSLIFVGPNSSSPGQKVYPRDWNNFGPAIGFAWQVPWFGQGKTTVRGGYQVQFLGGGRGFPLEEIIGNPPGSTNYPLYTGDSVNTYLDLTDLPAAVPVEPVFPPLRQVPITDRTVNLNAFDPNYVSPYIQNVTLALTRSVSSRVTVDLRYIGTLSRKIYTNMDLNVPNFLHNGLKEAFDAARSGGESQLLNDMFAGINIAGAGYGPVGTVQNGVLQTGAIHLRAATAALGGGGPIRNNLANGNYAALANALSSLNYSGAFNPTLPFIPTGVNGAVLRFSGKFPENFIKTNPQLANAVWESNLGHANYHSLQTQVTLRPAYGVSLQGSYIWSRNLGVNPGRGPNNTGGVFTDPTDRAPDYTLLASHRLHVFRTYGTFNLPIGPKQLMAGNSSGILARLIEEWQASWIVNLASGSPASVTAQNMLYGLGVPDLAGPFNFKDGKVTWPEGAVAGNFFNNAYSKVRDPQCNSVTASQGLRDFCTLNAIADAKTGQIVLQNPLPGRRGNLGRNTFYNAGTWSADMAISKAVRLGESRSLQFRLDASNIFNHPTPGVPGIFGGTPGGSDLNLNNTAPFGNIPTKTTSVPQAPDRREFQLKVRLDF